MTVILVYTQIFDAWAKTDGQLCREQNQPKILQLDKQIMNLQKLPQEAKGVMKEVGECTKRAIKLGLTSPPPRDYPDVVAKEDVIDCLQIDIYELEQECACRDLGRKYDPQATDAVLDEYRKVRQLEGKALNLAIKNPAIRTYVQSLSTSKDCVSQATLIQLQNTYEALTKIDLMGDGGQ